MKCSLNAKQIFIFVLLVIFAAGSLLAKSKHRKHHLAKKQKPVYTQPAPQEAPKANINTSTGFTPEQTQEIQNIVHEYLVKNPKVLLEVSNSLQTIRDKEMLKMQDETKNVISKNIKKLFDIKNPIAIGNHNSDVVIFEFFDYQCNHCKSMNMIIEKVIKADPNLEVVFIDWPIFNADSIYAAKAALVAHKKGKYMEMHNSLLAEDTQLSKDRILQIAKSVGLDEKALKKDVGGKFIQNTVKTNFKLAQDLKLIAAPAFILSDRQGKKFDFLLGQVKEKDLLQAIAGIRAK